MPGNDIFFFKFICTWQKSYEKCVPWKCKINWKCKIKPVSYYARLSISKYFNRFLTYIWNLAAYSVLYFWQQTFEYMLSIILYDMKKQSSAWEHLRHWCTWVIWVYTKLYPEWPHRHEWLPRMLKDEGSILGRGCTDLFCARRRLGRTAHEGGGCDQSIGSTVTDAIVRSWLWSTATRSSTLGYFSSITESSW